MRPRILVIDDHQDGGEVLVDMLDYNGYNADFATTAEGGMTLLRQYDYQAALIDLALPGMNGFEMVQALRERGSIMPCVACTAYHASKVRKEALNAGFDAYLTKPVSQKELVAVLKQVLAK
jgi:DNA-binding response OmpR family regulator